MKVSNAVVGMQVQAKRDCHGYADEFIREGLICTISRIDDQSSELGYELRLQNPDIDRGYAWVNASDVRRYKEEVPVVRVPEEPQDNIQVGDSVLVGAEGAGYGFVDKAYAGLTCTVHPRKHSQSNIVYIQHPNVRDSSPYAAHKRYLTKVDPKPKELTLADIQVGDWVVCSSGYNLTIGVAYKVVGFTAWESLLVSNPSERHASWVKGFAVNPSHFNKVLREVQPEPKYKYIPCTIDNTNVGDIVRCVNTSGLSSSDLYVGGTYRVQENDRSSVPFELVDKGTGDYIAWVRAHRVEKEVEVCTNQNG